MPQRKHLETSHKRNEGSMLSKERIWMQGTEYLARMARGKLINEARQLDHDLRLLVGHANLLDRLIIQLSAGYSHQQ